ncbi:MAG: cytochrome c biogenesis protein CcdA [Candidatus Eremiobacteraeota bacterium]|nr:cytochrome c biogenesis protein CcdA [Candidatus Eremiobacteraeota bacterium]
MSGVATAHLTVGIAFLAGLVSFVSPCVLPLVPAYLSFLTGTSLEELQAELTAQARVRTVLHSLAFILGFTLIFVGLGVTASALGGALRANQILIARIGGIIVIVLGLQMMGIFKLRFLMMDKRFHSQPKERSYFASVLVGLAFAAGWSPCVGPVLSLILAFAAEAQHVADGAWLLFVYSMGLALPFFAVALAIGVVLPALNRMKRYLPAIEFGAGAFLVLTGLVIFSNSFLRIAGWFYQFVPTPKL